jgi:hypothetical protein
MNIQKAMRVRSELKKRYSDLSSRIRYSSSAIVVTTDSPELTEDLLKDLEVERSKKLNSLDGRSYSEACLELFKLGEELEKINKAIEVVNSVGHNLLFKECRLKNELAFVDQLVANDRGIDPVVPVTETDYTEKDALGRWKEKKGFKHSFSLISDTALGMPLKDLKKKLEKELESIRDELAAFNAKSEVAYELPENL